MDLLEKLRGKAKKLGAQEFGVSGAKNKRYYVIYNNKIINFGGKNSQTFIDHGDPIKRKNWKKRHSKILRAGKPAYKNKESGSFWAWHLLWP